MRLHRFERRDFVRERFDWVPGEHAFFCEPTQQGKSELAWQLLQEVISRYEGTGMRFASLMPKPADPATSKWAPRIGLQVMPEWPPRKRIFRREPPGYVVWPPHLKDAGPEVNRKHVGEILRRCMNDQYWRGNSLTFADDAHIAAVLMDLNREMEEHLTAGGGMGSALWTAAQKPSGSASTGSLTTFVYNSPAHLFFGHDPDQRNLKRLSEIGGVNPDQIAEIVKALPMHRIQTPQGPKNISEKLYLNKIGTMCIVGV